MFRQISAILTLLVTASAGEFDALELTPWAVASSEDARARFWREGVIVLPPVLSNGDIEALADGIHQQLDRFALDEAARGSERSMSGLLQRLQVLETVHPGAVALLHNAGHITDALIDVLYTRPEMLQVVAALLNTSDVDAHPVWNYRGQVAGAVRNNLHQDACFWPPRAALQPIVSAWVPLVDVGLESGTLLFVPGGHAGAEGNYSLWRHKYKANAMSMDQGVLEELFGHRSLRQKAVVVPRGSVVLFHQLSIHGPMPHDAPHPRVSIDLRYLPAGAQHHLDIDIAPRPLMRGGVPLAVDHDEWRRTSYSTDQRRRGMCGGCGSKYEAYPEHLLGPLSPEPARWSQEGLPLAEGVEAPALASAALL